MFSWNDAVKYCKKKYINCQRCSLADICWRDRSKFNPLRSAEKYETDIISEFNKIMKNNEVDYMTVSQFKEECEKENIEQSKVLKYIKITNYHWFDENDIKILKEL